MIDINLIPIHLRKKSGKSGLQAISIPAEILLGVGGLFLVIVLGVHGFLGWLMIANMGQHKASEVKWESLQKDKKNLDSLSEEIKGIKKKMTTLTGITAKQGVAWSHKLNLMSDHMPKTIWLRRVYLDSTGFFIDGSAYSRTENTVNIIGGYATSLKNEESFMKGFVNLDVNSILTNKRKNTDVADFIIAAKVK